jgi:23S rRNA pseudouridine1911/1915/1917 synthase
MICANTRLAAFKLYKEMIGGNIKKAYIALLDGSIKEDEGILRSYMGRCEDSIVKRKICSEDEQDAKIAITAFITLCRSEKHSLVLASPVTGRTHQLRLHFSSIGNPITGDTMYGFEHPELKRHALHSTYTEFAHPGTGECVSLYSDLPEDICNLLNKEMLKSLSSVKPQADKLMNLIKSYEE